MKKTQDIARHLKNYFLQEKQEIKDPVLLAWLAASQANRLSFKRYVKIWNKSSSYMDSDAFDTEKAWMNIHKIHEKKQKSRLRLKHISFTLSGVAASILILFILSLPGLFRNQADLLVSISAGPGSRPEITLPDGSDVRLNAGSDIHYSYNQKKKIREVLFQGEGFFDISKSKDPFVIKLSDGLEVKVLGTSFNLKAYAGDETIQASLVEGCIELNVRGETHRMHAGEMVVYDKTTYELKQTKGIPAHAYGWLENKLYMNNMSLNEVCKYLERWYNVEIKLERKLGESIHYNGVLKEESITDVMEALRRLSNIDYEIKGKNVCITFK